MSDRLARKLLIVGWDAADWKIIDALFARGEMPNLRKLVVSGVRADLATLEPRLSPLLWTTIATGKTADKHGILNFIEPQPDGGGVRISSSTSRKTKALWNMLTQSNLNVNVLGWYASHPAEPIRGVCVSNLFQENPPATAREPWPLPGGAVHPDDFAHRVSRQRMHPKQVVEAMLRPLIPKLERLDTGDSRLTTLRKLLAQCYSVHRSTLSVLTQNPNWDCTMVFYDSVDTIGHHFMEFHPPRMAHVSERDFTLLQDVMVGVYRLHDALLGELLKAAGSAVTVLLLSDHGFHSDALRPKPVDVPTGERAAVEAAWHRPFGILTMAGPGVRQSKPDDRPISAGLLDITPTALTLLGLPVGRDMQGRVLVEAFDRAITPTVCDSWDNLPGEAGMHPAEMRLDPFESHDALKQLIDLGYIADLSADVQALIELTRRESRFNCAMVFITTNRAAQAVPILEKLVEQAPLEPRYVVALSQSLYTTMQWDKCIECLRTFLAAKPDRTEARLMLAAALGASGKRQPALDELQRIESDERVMREIRPNTLIMIADGYSVLQEWDSAQRLYGRALKEDPGNPHVLHGLARAALGRKQFDEAVDYALSALEKQYVYPEAHYLLGVALAWLGDFPHAVQSFQIAVAQQPGFIDAHRFLVILLERLQDAVGMKKHQATLHELLNRDTSTRTSAVSEGVMGPGEWQLAHPV